jgi:hypothetical protein
MHIDVYRDKQMISITFTLVVIMHVLHSVIFAMSQLPISARRAKMNIYISMRAKNAYQ